MDYTRWALPLVVIGMVVLLAALLRWTYSRGQSLVNDAVPSADRTPAPEVFVVVRVRANYIEAEIIRLELRAGDLAAELAQRGAQVVVLVRERDLPRAEELLTGYPR